MPQMLLKACPHCRRAVGPSAQRCPYCGGSLAIGAVKDASVESVPDVIDGAHASQLKTWLALAVVTFWAGVALGWFASPSVAPGGEPLSAAAMLVPLLAGLMMLAGAVGYAVMTRRIARLRRALPDGQN